MTDSNWNRPPRHRERERCSAEAQFIVIHRHQLFLSVEADGVETRGDARPPQLAAAVDGLGKLVELDVVAVAAEDHFAAALSSVVVVDDFDVVAVGVEHVRGVVAVVVAGALARLAVAAVSGRGRVGVEAADVVVVAREGEWMFCVGSPAITMEGAV